MTTNSFEDTVDRGLTEALLETWLSIVVVEGSVAFVSRSMIELNPSDLPVPDSLKTRIETLAENGRKPKVFTGCSGPDYRQFVAEARHIALAVKSELSGWTIAYVDPRMNERLQEPISFAGMLDSGSLRAFPEPEPLSYEPVSMTTALTDEERAAFCARCTAAFRADRYVEIRGAWGIDCVWAMNGDNHDLEDLPISEDLALRLRGCKRTSTGVKPLIRTKPIQGSRPVSPSGRPSQKRAAGWLAP